jgi:glycolate oxidase
MELVQPSAEILQFGSLGSGAGWFSSNGPGPSLRGMVRGASGAGGSLGVFTKCAFRLSPWPGPRETKITGVSPYYEAEVPPLFEYHVLEWPTWEQCADALYKIGAARIMFAMHKTGGPGTHGSIVTGSNNEYYANRQAGDLPMPRVSYGVVLYAASQKEHDFGVKVLDRILAETGGRIFPQTEAPDFKKRDYLNMVKACFIPRMAYRITGSFAVDGIVGLDSIDNCALGNKLDDIHSDKVREKGMILDDGTNNSWATIFDGGHFAVTECGQAFDLLDSESRKGAEEMVKAGFEISFKTPIAIGTSPMSGAAQVFGPSCSNYHLWINKIKKAYDPDNRFGGAMEWAIET